METKHLFYLIAMFSLIASCSKDEQSSEVGDEQINILEYKILGSTTDAAINDLIENDSVVGPNEGNHVFFGEGTAKRNKLFLFFPGTNSLPSWHRMIGEKAASMGYHSIILRYNNINPIFTFCGNSMDRECHRKARMEVLTGEDLEINNVDVDRVHSIENRLVKLLQYLDISYSGQNWGQYLTSSGEINWSKIVVAGHSQGGGYAGFISKLHLVDRAILISASDWYQGAPAEWVTEPGETPANRIYGFVHLRDEAGYFGPGQIIAKNWEGYGIDALGDIVNVDGMHKPYNNSHTIVTNAEPSDFRHWFHDDKYHNGVIVDPFVPLVDGNTALYDEVWEYLLD